MSNEALRIELVRVVDLYKFYRGFHQGRADVQGTLPICRQRAFAQTRNPYADDTDIGLLVAYDGTQCVGYLGLLPGILKARNVSAKIHWFSGWFVDPHYRNTSVGAMLLMKAFALNYDFFMTGLSRHSEDAFRALHLPQVGPLKYYALNLNWPTDLLTLPLRAVRRFLGLLKMRPGWLDRLISRSMTALAVLKGPMHRMLLRGQKTGMDGWYYEEVNQIDQGPVPPKNPESSAVFYRGPEIINWMLQDKWVPDADVKAVDANYAFLVRPTEFKYIAVRVSDVRDKAYKGFMVMALSSLDSVTVLRLLDFSFEKHDDYRCIGVVMLTYAAAHRADRIELAEPAGDWLNDSALARLLLRKKTRSYFCRLNGSIPAACLANIELSLCDGDVAFTAFS